MTNDDKNEFYFLEYDYLSLREEMRDNLKYQKELGWACIAAVLAFLGAVLVKNDVIPELCLLPLPILLFCSAKVNELKKSNIRIVKYINTTIESMEKADEEKSKQSKSDAKKTVSKLRTQLWERELYLIRTSDTDKKPISKKIIERIVYVLATSEYIIMGIMCLLIYAMKTMKGCGCVMIIKELRGCGLFVIGFAMIICIGAVSWRYWRITKKDLIVNNSKKE